MRIGLNLLHAMPEIGGGWNYIASLVTALGEEDRENDFVAFVTKASRELVSDRPRWTRVDCPLDARSRMKRVVFETTRLQLLSRRHRLDCMHWFDYTQAPWNAVPAVVSLWDLQPFLKLFEYRRSKRVFLQVMLRWMAARRPFVLPMSRTTAEGFQRILGFGEERMAILPPILDASFRPPAPADVEAFRERHGLPERFWLYVAHAYPHKNHVRLLEAYASLEGGGRDGWPLVLRGDQLEADAAVAGALDRLALRSRVRFLPRLGPGELPLLYGAATAQVFPSLYEGGGIPVLEAMACGCPVAASDLPVFREFAGDAIVRFDPESIAEITDVMRRIEDGRFDLPAIRLTGLAATERFRGKEVVPIAIRAYRRAAGMVAAAGHGGIQDR